MEFLFQKSFLPKHLSPSAAASLFFSTSLCTLFLEVLGFRLSKEKRMGSSMSQTGSKANPELQQFIENEIQKHQVRQRHRMSQ